MTSHRTAMTSSPTVPTYLFVLPWSLEHVGGVNQVVLNLAQQMERQGGWRALVLIMDWSARRPVWEIQQGVQTLRWRVRPFNPIAGLKERLVYALWERTFRVQLHAICCQRNVMAINMHYAAPQMFTFQRLSRSWQTVPPLILSFHGADLSSLAQQGPRRIAAWRALLPDLCAVVACSQDLARRISDILGPDVSPRVVPNGLEMDAFVNTAGDSSVESDASTILSVGKFEYKKGQDILLKAFASIEADYPKLTLNLLGATDDALLPLRELVNRLGLSERVRFFPDVPHAKVAAFFSRARLFVLPSRLEPFGIVILEAGAFGLPVIASNVGGIPEIITDGDTGRLVPAEDVQGLAEAMREFLDDPQSARAMGARLQARVQSKYTWSAAWGTYQEMVATSPMVGEDLERTSMIPENKTLGSEHASSCEHHQSAYHRRRSSSTEDVDADVWEAMRVYLTEDLGIAAATAEARADVELERRIPKSVVAGLRENGVTVQGACALDLGAGLGGMSEELLLSGAEVTSLEPGNAWAQLTERRVGRHGGNFQLLKAFGENIPLPDNSVDLIVSLQVLEHVKDPGRVLEEAYRVLRPGGHFFLACENYLAFWEPHYRVPWLPLMPKQLGALYLRLMGRSPAFLLEAITYTTYPGVLRVCRELGFRRARDVDMVRSLIEKDSLVWRAMRVLAWLTRGRGPAMLDDVRILFRVGIYELFQKQ